MFIIDLSDNSEFSIIQEFSSEAWKKVLAPVLKDGYVGMTEDLFPTFEGEIEEDKFARLSYLKA